MGLVDFDFALPDELIARYALEQRSESRLMRLHPNGARSHHRFEDLSELLLPNDLLVLNDTYVFKARIYGEKSDSGGKVEMLLVEPNFDGSWKVMVRASKRIRVGQLIRISRGGGEIRVVDELGEGFFSVRLPEDAHTLARRYGELPLPPYLGRPAEAADEQRYQTVYADASKAYSVAAPTAGLHFTPKVFSALEARGVERTYVTLHVGPGTFLPVRADTIEEHRMHYEHYHVGPEATAALARAEREGRRVVAVGTTSARVLESFAGEPGAYQTNLFIRPGYTFRRVGALVTNFHLPKSTLLMLVAALAGQQRILDAYKAAISAKYRFYSYGDAMFIEAPRKIDA
ncbi:MAG: tRNA preQ1(34) S-adenosylmethionine ribosyltransferase-isomerase QueA [Myxococcales bacterium]|nr:tRNA preQ1(34) S-adenosylmethionine ribosyltransferase-isomerase QueA [Myxococcales bacterium]